MVNLNRGFYLPVSDENEPQNPVPFTVTFVRSPYPSYQSFVDWLFASDRLTLIYNPTGNQEYCRDVSVNFLQKGELNQVGWLECPASFFCLTPWYLPSPTELQLEATGEDRRKRYSYRYNQRLRYGTDSTASMTTVIAGSGHVPGALEIVFHGAITNPKIRLVGRISGKVFGLCSVATVLAPGESLHYCSRYEDSFVRKISALEGQVDLLDVLDLSTIPFIHIPVNEPCTLTIESDGAFSGRADLTIYYYYRSV